MTSEKHSSPDNQTFTQEHFLTIKDVIYNVCGITLADHKAQMVSNRIAKRIKILGLPGYDAYVEYLMDKKHRDTEIPDLVNVCTTNVTHFFRENHHFEVLKEQLKTLLQQNPNKKIRIWSAGCSSGQEPYSMAMTVLDVRKETGMRGNIRILATDIDTTILARARQGIYGEDSLKGVSPEYRQKYLTIEPGSGGAKYRVNEDVRDLVSFNHLNLNMPLWPMKGPFQAVFCRNVLIYFDRDKQRTYVNKMAQLMEPGALLYLGHSEHYAGAHPMFVSKGHTTYERIA